MIGPRKVVQFYPQAHWSAARGQPASH